ncbi:hypothetical protein CSIM01_09665 [Colletotrichum simmondsii]|uniref:Uncharacterized protein n=1 Tax=Colletotrichum simmondsii TaxID=703756 RepID=A0A135TBV5_9PEZI|nr:hypothetical protein CSIM01_09665 [Colletotrichum simmondsii]
MISRPVTPFSFRHQPPTARCRIHIVQDHFLRIPSIHDTITDTAPHHPSRIPTLPTLLCTPSSRASEAKHSRIHAPAHRGTECILPFIPFASGSSTAHRQGKRRQSQKVQLPAAQAGQGSRRYGTLLYGYGYSVVHRTGTHCLALVSTTSTRKSITTNDGGIKLQIRSTAAHRNLGPGPLAHGLAWPPVLFDFDLVNLTPRNSHPSTNPSEFSTWPPIPCGASTLHPLFLANPRTHGQFFPKTSIRIASPVSAYVPALDQDSQPASHNRYLASGPMPCLALATPSQQLRQPTSPCAPRPGGGPALESPRSPPSRRRLVASPAPLP